MSGQLPESKAVAPDAAEYKNLCDAYFTARAAELWAMISTYAAPADSAEPAARLREFCATTGRDLKALDEFFTQADGQIIGSFHPC